MQTPPQETVTRPDPGLARGKWEAPAWTLWAVLALVILGTGAYVALRVLRKRAGKK